MADLKRAQRNILSEDGELSFSPDDAVQAEPIYCTRCGTANAPDSNYCRKCGHSLDEQEADMLGVGSQGGPKAKHEEMRLRGTAPAQGSATAKGTAQVLTMLMVLGVGVTAFVTAGGINAWVIIPVVIVWFLVEALRNAKSAHITGTDSFVQVMTTLLVCALSIAALLVERGINAWVVIPLLIGWFLIEAVRSL